MIETDIVVGAELRITCSKDELVQGLGVVGRAVSTRTSVQILSGILLEASGSELRLAATDMELSLRATLPAQVQGDGAIVLPGRTLVDIARLLPAAEVTIEQAYEMARNCALNHLAKMKAALGDLDRVERIVKVIGYVNVAPGFVDVPKVINGESDLLVALWGERGEHTRAAIGVAALAADAPVEVEVTVQVRR